MKSILSSLLFLFVTSTVSGAEPTFDEILKNVESREERTGAILRVQSSQESRVKGAPAVYSFFDMRIEDKTAHVDMYNNYLTGKKGVSFKFAVTPQIEAEHARLQNLARLRQLDQAVADAERKRRIFVLSSFKLKEGSGIEQVEAVFGRPTSVIPWMKAGWDTLVFRDVSVVMAFDKVHDIQPNRR